MKLLALTIVLLLMSCHKAAQDSIIVPPVVDVTDEIYAEVAIETGTVRLVNHDGECSLQYDRKGNSSGKNDQLTDIGIEAPCNFVRNPGGDRAPNFYTWQKGRNRRTVFLIVGGPPDPSKKDEFMPNGCGTRLAKIRVFDDRVELVRAGGIDDANCPSWGMDEVDFAT
jgi:hypothetical protein